VYDTTWEVDAAQRRAGEQGKFKHSETGKLVLLFLRPQQIELSAAVPRRTVGLLAMRGPMGLTTPTTFVSRGPVGAKEARVVVSISDGEPRWEPYRLKPDIILLALKSQSRSNHLSILVWGSFKDSFVLHFS
jgi:hypothetical protein